MALGVMPWHWVLFKLKCLPSFPDYEATVSATEMASYMQILRSMGTVCTTVKFYRLVNLQ